MIRKFALLTALAACVAAAPVRAQGCGRLLTLLDADARGLTAATLRFLPRGGGIAIEVQGASAGLPPARQCELNSEDGENELRCQWEYPEQAQATAAFDGLLDRMRRCLGADSMTATAIIPSPNGWRPVQRHGHEIEREEGGSSEIELELVEYIAEAQAGAAAPAAVYYVVLSVLREED